MQDAVGKMNKSIKNISKKNTTKHLSSGGQELAELVREATAKALHRPDTELNQQVVDLIGSTVHADGPRAVAKILTDRLEQKNAHKVWLAIMLIREVLQKAMKELGPAREDIMSEVEKVASAPMDRFDKNLKDQQSTKHAAFELLKVYGKDGHILSQPQHEREEADRRAHVDRLHSRQSQKSDVVEKVRTQLLAIDYQIDLLQELMLDKTEFSKKSPQDQVLAKDVLVDAQKFGQEYERLLGLLSAVETSEAQALMKQSLEKMDILNNSLSLHREMIKSQAEQLAGKPYSELKSPRRGSRDGRKDVSPRTRPAEEGSLIDLQESPAAPSASQSQVAPYQDPFAASWQPPGQHSAQQQQQPPQQRAPPQQSQQPNLYATQQPTQQSQQQNPYGAQQSTQQSHQQNPYAAQQGPYPNQFPPSYPGAQGQQAPLSFRGTYPGPQAPTNYPPYGGNYGGYSQHIPGYGQPPPNYGTPYQHPPDYGSPYPQWNQQQPPGGFPQPSQGLIRQAESYPGSSRPAPPPYQPIRPQSSLQSQFSGTSDFSNAASARQPQQSSVQHQIPIYTADVTIPEPIRESAKSVQPVSSRAAEQVAASLPITDVAKPEDVGFGDSAFPSHPPAHVASPVPPTTPANPQASSRSADSPADSAEKQSISKPAPGGFESSAFNAPTSQQPRSQIQPQGAANSAQPVKPVQEADEWDLFFNERANKANAGGNDVAGAFGGLSLNPPK